MNLLKTKVFLEKNKLIFFLKGKDIKHLKKGGIDFFDAESISKHYMSMSDLKLYHDLV
jgi:hypothetical protein